MELIHGYDRQGYVANSNNIWGPSGSSGEGVLHRVSERDYFNIYVGNSNVTTYDVDSAACEESKISLIIIKEGINFKLGDAGIRVLG